jgi:hypothetical protein
MKSVTIQESSVSKETPKKTTIHPKYFDSQEKPKRQSARLQKATKLESGKKIPSFISGYHEGQPMYTLVRVVPEDIVARIEDEISIQEKKEFQKQTSEMNM